MANGSMRVMTVSDENTLVEARQPLPVPADGEVRIAVRAAGINRADVLQRRGMYPAPKGAPAWPGLEVSGVIDAVGPGVMRWKAGDEVCALLAGGGYAEAVCVDEGSVLSKPDGLNFVQAASLPESLFTVYANVFDACALRPGERLLVHGGTSGIGVAAIQMARLFGCEVFTTQRTEGKCELAASLGATRAINYSDEDFEAIMNAAGGADVILDMVGGDYVQKNINSLREGGRLVNIAYQKGPVVTLNLLRVMLKRITITGSTLRARPAEEKRRLRDGLEPLFWNRISDGTIRPVVDCVFALTDAAAAHDRMESGSHVGKIVLDVTL